METTVIQAKTGELAFVEAPALDQNPAVVYVAGLGSEAGRRTMRQALNAIADRASLGQQDMLTFPWHALGFQHTAAIRAQLASNYKAATANKMLAALRGTLKAAWRLGQMGAEEYQRAVDLKAVRGSTLPAGRSLRSGEVAAIMGACAADRSPAGARDAAILAVMAVAGPRRSEIVALDFEDYDALEGRLLIRHGKGNKERAVYLDGGAQGALADWLTVRGDSAGPLFWRIGRGGKPQPFRLTSQAIYNLCGRRAGEGHVKHFSPHDLRRTVAGDMMDAGADVTTVARVLGHANLQTTMRYDRRPEEATKRAANLLHVPYTRRTQ